MVTGQTLRVVSRPLFVAVFQAEFAAVADVISEADHVDRVGRDVALSRGADRRFQDERAQAFGDGGGDLGDEVLGGFGQHRVAAAGDELRAQNGGFDFVGGQH
jgi:hypothetical protein